MPFHSQTADTFVLRLALDAIGHVAFRFDLQATHTKGTRIVDLYNNIIHQTNSLLFQAFPLIFRLDPTRWHIFDNIAEFHTRLQDIIDQRREELKSEKEDPQDILGLMIKSVQSNAEDALSEKELRVKIYIQYNCYFA
jgi:cytochrome P450